MASTADLVAPDKQTNNNPMGGFISKVRHVFALITVEPIIASYVVASLVCAPALFNLEFEKACRVNLRYNDTICEAILGDAPHNYTMENAQIQILIGNMHSWQVPLQSVVPLILVLFLGAYSDRHRIRKPFLLVPIFGEFFAVFGCALCVFFMNSWPLEAQGVSQTIISSLFGSQPMLVMAVFAYIADVSSLEMRTLRVGIVQIVLNVCTPLAQSMSGVLFEKIGYYGVLSIAMACFVFGFTYGLFCISEPRQVDDKIDKPKVHIVRDMFDPKHALETVHLLVKNSEHNHMLFIWLIMIILFIYSLVNTGEGGIIYLYTQSIFHWTPVEYSYFITTNTLLHMIGTAIGVPVFANLLKLKDLTILLLTFIDKTATNIILGLATTVNTLYIGVFVSFITGMSGVAIRSLITKVVSDDDLGKAQSLFGICEAIGPAIAAPLYNKAIYLNTLDTFPAAYFFVGVALYLFCMMIIVWMYFCDKSKNRQIEVNGYTNDAVTEDVQMTHI